MLYGIAIFFILFGLILNYKNNPGTPGAEPDAVKVAYRSVVLGVMLLFVAPFLVLF